MPISTYDAYAAKINALRQSIQESKLTTANRTAALSSMWTTTPVAGAVPTTSVACTRSFTGAIGQFNSSGVQRLAQVSVSLINPGVLIIADRLVHQGGLSGTDTAEQTTNLPTAALTRYTSGVGVMAAAEVYTTIGGTARTFTVSYTNEQGTSGRTSLATTIGSVNYNQGFRFMPINLAEGDRGVRSVESLTLSATTGTVGNFGITLFRPLMIMPVFDLGSLQQSFDGLFMGNMPSVLSDACLFYIFSTSGLSTGGMMNLLRFIEE